MVDELVVGALRWVSGLVDIRFEKHVVADRLAVRARASVPR